MVHATAVCWSSTVPTDNALVASDAERALVEAVIERDNAETRAHFLQRWLVFTAEQVAEAAAQTTVDRRSAATRWKTARCLFVLRADGREVYPAFQFEGGRPRPVIGMVLEALPDDMSDWQRALWFSAPNGWLNGRSPVETLQDEAAVVTAAERERDAWAG
jgi:hypothetical protein